MDDDLPFTSVKSHTQAQGSDPSGPVFYAVFDTETSGLMDMEERADAPQQPRLASLSIIRLYPNLTLESHKTWFVRPNGWEMTPGATKINGLTTQWLIDHGMDIERALAGYNALLDEGRTLIAHNAKFDLKVMRGELRRAGLSDRFNDVRYRCTMRQFSKIHNCRWKSLMECLKYYNLPYSFSNHTSGGDAYGCMALFRKMYDNNEWWG
jgi:DNA polymerase III subunit epsilon